MNKNILDMKNNSINPGLQIIDFQTNSAIIQCHVDKKRLWILYKNGDFDYYSNIGSESPFRISIGKNSTPRRLWSNQKGTRFIVETVDFSLFYFQTQDTTAINSKRKTTTMKNFYRIGSLKSGPASAIYFDDDMDEIYDDPKSDEKVDIYIVVKGGGVLVLSIISKSGKITVDNFHSFPDLFAGLNVLDFLIYSVIERRSDEEIIKEFDNEAKKVGNVEAKFVEIPESIYFSILRNDLSDIEGHNWKSYSYIEEFDSLLKERNSILSKTNQTKSDSTANKRFLSKISNFIKEFRNRKLDFDMIYPKDFKNSPTYSIWSKCLSSVKKVDEKTENAIKNLFEIAFFYQQLCHLSTSNKHKNIPKLTFYQDSSNRVQLFRKAKNQESQQFFVRRNSKKKKSFDEEEKFDDENNFTEDKNTKMENENDKDENIEYKFEDDFCINENRRKRERGNNKKAGNNKPSPSQTLIDYKSEIDKIIESLQDFVNNNNKVDENILLNKLNESISDRNKKIDEINENIDFIKKCFLDIFQINNIIHKKFDPSYMKERDKYFKNYKEEKSSISYIYFDSVNNHIEDLLHVIDEQIKFFRNFFDSLNSFCTNLIPFFDDISTSKFDNKYTIKKSYLVALAEDRIIFRSDDKPLNNLQALNNNNNTKETCIYKFVNNFKINEKSRLVHKPFKNSPLRKHPSFIIIGNDSDTSVCFSFNKTKLFRYCEKRLKDTDEKLGPEDTTNLNLNLKNKKKSNKNNKEKSEQSQQEQYNLYGDLNLEKKSKSQQEQDSNFLKKKSKFTFISGMTINYYQVTPSGLLVVQSDQRANSKAVAYELSAFLTNLKADKTINRGKELWKVEITDYSLLPILNCDFCPRTGLLIYNSMSIQIIDRKNVDLNSFKILIDAKDPQVIQKARNNLAFTQEQKNQAFFVLLVYAIKQLYVKEESEYQHILQCMKKSKGIIEQENYLKNDAEYKKKKSLKIEAREILMKLLDAAPCSKMQILLFLMDTKQINSIINHIIESKNNDGKLLERFKRFRIEYLNILLQSYGSIMTRQKTALLMLALDLLMQTYVDCNNNKHIFYPSKLKSKYEIDIDSKKCFIDKIDIEDITSLLNKHRDSLLPGNFPLYIIKCFPTIDVASSYAKKESNYIEYLLSKIQNYMITTDDGNYAAVQNTICENYSQLNYVNEEEFDFLLARFLLSAIEHKQKKEMVSKFFEKFTKLVPREKVSLIPHTILSLFTYLYLNIGRNKGNDAWIKSQPIVNYMKEYYKKNPGEPTDLFFSILASMERFRELEELKNYDKILAIYRSSKLRNTSANLLKNLGLISIAIDVVLDEGNNSASMAIKFTSSLDDPNKLLYLIRTASRKMKNEVKNDAFTSIYNSVVDSKKNCTFNKKLYDVLMCIPHEKLNELESLKRNIFKNLENIDAESDKCSKKILRQHDKMKANNEMVIDNSFMLNSPFRNCEICNNTVFNEAFTVFPCGHVFHKNCLDARMLKDQFDREQMKKFHPDKQVFSTTINDRICPICGLSAIDLINTPMYQTEDNKFMRALSKNSNYIVEDNDYDAVDDDDI